MVRRISLFVSVAVFLGCFSFAQADEISAVDSVPTTGIHTKGRISLQLVSGALFSLRGFPVDSPALSYAQTNLRLGWMLGTPGTDRSVLRGNWEGLVELSNSIIFKGPGNYIGGITGLLRYNFVQPDLDLIPYIQGGVGIVYNDVYEDDTQQAIGQAIEFTPQCSIGVHYLIDKNWAAAAEGMFYHISSAGMSKRNNSLNSLGGFIGVTYFFD